ncbi:hypothetical protein DX928_11840 [Bacillus swezeyi]|uniref:Uncharacterized protein n=1 Tax=Bacillus swezeyi TaxID=1925020 RepID=A0A5M8RUH1_9BACI|nr:hypothetical protein DX927_10000 [Bacillus swezeyi]KAA6474732.1 hypothetical protein DX928_11840 [Bacillus swezeyi]
MIEADGFDLLHFFIPLYLINRKLIAMLPIASNVITFPALKYPAVISFPNNNPRIIDERIKLKSRHIYPEAVPTKFFVLVLIMPLTR